MFGRLKASMREQAFHPGLLDLKFVQMAYITLLVLLVTISFVYSPGTGDVEIWKRWANNSDAFGIASGFKANKADYPPYSSIILLCAIRFSLYFILRSLEV
jgi:hypothetical protein